MSPFIIEGTLWKWNGPSAWFFLSTTHEQGAALKARQTRRLGWGSVRVQVTIGATTFDTSLFPTKEGPYLLPVKASVRKSESLKEGSRVLATCAFTPPPSHSSQAG